MRPMTNVQLIIYNFQYSYIYIYIYIYIYYFRNGNLRSSRITTLEYNVFHSLDNYDIISNYYVNAVKQDRNIWRSIIKRDN